MLAISGAKGGCGKTTVALGVAEAFAGKGTPVLVADADRQMPNLHAVTGVDREPTLADVRDPSDVETVARPSPDAENVGIVPAPTDSQLPNVEAALACLDDLSVRTIVDCPPGAGPDVVEPLSAAEAVVVVTDGTRQSIDAAKTTMQMARRLDVEVVGIVANRCESIPDELLEETDVPVLGTVPERDRPLRAEDARDAFRDVVTGLVRARQDGAGLEVPPSDRMSSGIDPIDREFQGGLPPGSVVALVAEPSSQSELLLHELTSTRGTLYLSTQRSEAVVRDALETSNAQVGNATLRQLDEERPFEHATTLVENLPPKANLVVDATNDLERRDQPAYDDFLNTLIERMRETSGLAMLHCLEESPVPKNRTRTEHFVDVVLRLEGSIEDGTVRQRLTVPKSRRNRAPSGGIEIDLSEDLGVGRRSVEPER